MSDPVPKIRAKSRTTMSLIIREITVEIPVIANLSREVDVNEIVPIAGYLVEATIQTQVTASGAPGSNPATHGDGVRPARPVTA